MSQADAFVVTADQDCNAKLQEYLRWRKPILAFDGRANLFFTNGHNALLAPNGDYAPLILRLADDPTLCQKIADHAAQDIPVYTWREIAQQFEAFFTAVR
jgi:glycosyltransferase involved in cell wall biosynthesis